MQTVTQSETMDISAADLRKVSLGTRHKASGQRLQVYSVARDEALEHILKNAKEIMLREANAGKFKARIYEWVSDRSRKTSENDTAESSATDSSTEPNADIQLRFGESDGNNGLHIMTLVSPTGIPFHETLMHHLRTTFNGSSDEQASDDSTPEYKVYFSRNPKNTSQCGIWVSWETRNRQINGGRGRGRGRYGGGRGRLGSGRSSGHTSSE